MKTKEQYVVELTRKSRGDKEFWRRSDEEIVFDLNKLKKEREVNSRRPKAKRLSDEEITKNYDPEIVRMADVLSQLL